MAPNLSPYNPTTGIYTSTRPPVTLPPSPATSITDFLFRNLETHSDRPALIDPHSDRIVTFSDLKQSVSVLARFLSRTHNVSRGDVVLVFAPNSVRFPVAFFALASIGAITTTANPVYTVNELAHQINDSKPKLIITVDQLRSKVNGFGIPILDLEKENYSDKLIQKSSDRV
ncbi:hypothetical protein OSB04_013806 [Centaurea solstitialis]|uniref:AMP-dependent synthetase/ligase domain-containing protein n=1 Tax=Centaurea solstitialis TaxID=347529 RepID=A0AA38WFD1_9ASTR|nr:hypothetical protein OSB04_013806 [Centaurea solstitialis]